MQRGSRRSVWVLRSWWLSTLVLLLAASLSAHGSEVRIGSVLLASCEGLSVWDREGQRGFARFFVPDVPPAGAKASVVAWGDMIYDGHRLPSGNYLCSSHEWIREIAPDGSIVWEYRVQRPCELKTCVPLPNGNVMTVDGERMELIELAEKGSQIVRRIPVPTDPKAGIHVRYNLLRRTPEGTYLLGLRKEQAFIEVDESGRELWRHVVPGMTVVAERLASGHTLMSWRGGGTRSSGGLIEVDPQGTVVWKLDVGEVEGFHGWFGGFHRFENGNTLIANSDWHYHDAKESAVQLFEVTRNKQVVWKLGVEAFAGKKPGSLEPKTGNIEQRIIGIEWLGEVKR
jgi:hypothetical protein